MKTSVSSSMSSGERGLGAGGVKMEEGEAFHCAKKKKKWGCVETVKQPSVDTTGAEREIPYQQREGGEAIRDLAYGL